MSETSLTPCLRTRGVLSQAEHRRALRRADGPKEVYRLAYTGGTTGRSKGVLLTLRTLQAQVTNYLLEHVPGIERGDVMLHAAPVSHASGSYFLPHLVRGATSVLLPRFRTGEYLEWMERTGAQRTFLVPTMMATLLDEPNLADVEAARSSSRSPTGPRPSRRRSPRAASGRSARSSPRPTGRPRRR